MNAILISRTAAIEIANAWDAADINDDDSDYVLDNADVIEHVRSAWLELERAMNKQMRALLLIELSDAQARELFNEARNRLDIAKGWVKDSHPVAEAGAHRQAKVLVRALQRLLKQASRLGF